MLKLNSADIVSVREVPNDRIDISGWDDIDPADRRAGHFFDKDGNKHKIDLDDEHCLALANNQQTDTIFQFDTDLAKSILKHGVTNFDDLMILSACGHPGPILTIPDIIKNRDDKTGSWKKKMHPMMLKILERTYGYLVFQEQLQAAWQQVAGFTAPEAQEARKAVAKKWVEKLKPIEAKWINGATPILGEEEAKRWYSMMTSFGRYAFNESHSVSYTLVAHKCLWLKAHFAPEWYASVLSGCHKDKRIRHMNTAKSEPWSPTDITKKGINYGSTDRVVFGTINIENLTANYTVTGNVVNQGLVGIKGIGVKAAKMFQTTGKYENIDEFVNSPVNVIKKKKEVEGSKPSEPPTKKHKKVLERMIKLNAFKHLPGHENMKALWMYYQYKYCSSGKGLKELKAEIKAKLLESENWNEATIQEERERQTQAYKASYPKRNKIPPAIANWKPKPIETREKIMSLFPEDYTQAEKLEFQREYLGYWLDSPIHNYQCSGNTIEKAKQGPGKNGMTVLECIVEDASFLETKKKLSYLKLLVSDGIQQALVFIWGNELAYQNLDYFTIGTGLLLPVDYDESRGTFTLCRGQIVRKLRMKHAT